MKNFACFSAPNQRPEPFSTEEGPSRAANFMATGCFFVKKMRLGSTLFFVLALFLLFGAFSAHAERLPVVVLDPGHGGLNPGADLGDGVNEGQAALSLAKKIKGILDSRGEVRTVLTRDGDYNLPLHERAGAAAHNQARVFISLHAGRDWSRGGEPKILVAYYQARSPEFAGTEEDAAVQASLEARPWESAAQSQKAGSRRLADVLKNNLQNNAPPDRVRAGGYPLAVLAGADAPAVLVELTNMGGNSRVREEIQNRAAQDIARAIQQFLQ
ncbi:N-acetylmuramoyl-L-alanine amidase [Desulfatibacillum aliphaticivorans]|uniref:N-acetylmuramoyl-L-alanine amidase n=1 Tax=Desulfatibacillum aliphaticivorans TaxID=218208 RepID=UPI000400B3FD|nr:N-acetylmuramoyl-L-alanine amidase [Desulfatibacillum aliphaticivorans]